MSEQESDWSVVCAQHELTGDREKDFAEYVRGQGFDPATATLEDLDALVSEFLA